MTAAPQGCREVVLPAADQRVMALKEPARNGAGVEEGLVRVLAQVVAQALCLGVQVGLDHNDGNEAFGKPLLV